MAKQGPNGTLTLPAFNEIGYHRLELNDVMTTIAVAPPRAYTLDDVAQSRKLWGLTLQLYALRQQGDGGIGDFAALANFAGSAAAHGADAPNRRRCRNRAADGTRNRLRCEPWPRPFCLGR